MSKESSRSPRTPSEKPSDTHDLETLLPEGIDNVDDLGLMRTTNRNYPVVNRNRTREARQHLREVQALKDSIAEGANDQTAQQHLKALIPMLADMAKNHGTKRVRIQASRELREIIKMLEGPRDAAGSAGGGFSAGSVNLQINVDTRGGQGRPIISMSEADPE